MQVNGSSFLQKILLQFAGEMQDVFLYWQLGRLNFGTLWVKYNLSPSSELVDTGVRMRIRMQPESIWRAPFRYTSHIPLQYLLESKPPNVCIDSKVHTVFRLGAS